MKTYNYVKEISNYYAYWDFEEVWRNEGNWNVQIDREASARSVWKYFADKGTIKKAMQQPTEDRQREYLHLSILDYYSMHEPKVKG